MQSSTTYEKQRKYNFRIQKIGNMFDLNFVII